MTTKAEPVGGPILTRAFMVAAVVGIVGAVVAVWRMIAGLGATTGLSDGYPWGIWIAWEVVCGTGLACGGYAVAILVYVLNQGRFHHLIRPAILTSALGYSMAGIAIFLDVGRYWNLYKVPFGWWLWNFNSALLEVALCVMAYIVVLWLELFPAQMEKWLDSESTALRRIAEILLPKLDRALLWIIALGVLLPTMHQSSLGSLYLIATTRLHPLWHTAMLPLLFLVSCVGLGFAVVVLEAVLSSLVFKRQRENRMLAALSRVMVPILVLFLVLRFGDLAIKGRLGLIFTSGPTGWLFVLETALFVVPTLMLLSRRRERDLGHLLRASTLILLAGVLYRFDVYLIAYNPGPGWIYFPTLPEMMITFGIVALEIMAYVVIVKRYPILGGTTTVAAAPQEV